MINVLVQSLNQCVTPFHKVLDPSQGLLLSCSKPCKDGAEVQLYSILSSKWERIQDVPAVQKGYAYEELVHDNMVGITTLLLTTPSTVQVTLLPNGGEEIICHHTALTLGGFQTVQSARSFSLMPHAPQSVIQTNLYKDETVYRDLNALTTAGHFICPPLSSNSTIPHSKAGQPGPCGILFSLSNCACLDPIDPLFN